LLHLERHLNKTAISNGRENDSSAKPRQPANAISV
jgi:hypothetical protein